MTPIIITEITAEQTYPIRHPVLREGYPVETCHFDGDIDSMTQHFGAWLKDKLVGVCSVYQRSPKNSASKHDWQIRGMAVLPEFRGQKIGDRLLKHCLDFTYKSDAKASVWCNARVAAVNLYKRNGFHIIGEPFTIPTVGSHYRMVYTPLR